MGTAESKLAPPSSYTSFNDEERSLLNESFKSMNPSLPSHKHHKHAEPSVSFSSFSSFFGKNIIPEELQQYIFSNFIGIPHSNETINTNGMTFAQFVDGIARVMKGDRQKYYISLFSGKGSDISCHIVAKVLQFDSILWFNLSNIDPYPLFLLIIILFYHLPFINFYNKWLHVLMKYIDEEGDFKTNENDTFLNLGKQICFSEGSHDQVSIFIHNINNVITILILFLLF